MPEVVPLEILRDELGRARCASVDLDRGLAEHVLGWTDCDDGMGFDPKLEGRFVYPEFTRSVDAAQMLLPEGWFWRCGRTSLYEGWAFVNRTHPDHCDRHDEAGGTAASPALALCLAIVKVRIAIVEFEKWRRGVLEKRAAKP